MGSNSCIFCKIVAGQIPSKVLWEDEAFLAFQDLHPQAKIHALVVPKAHFASLLEAVEGSESRDPALLEKLLKAGVETARTLGIAESGFRSVINTGTDGGQTVFHLHLHIIGGEMLRGGMA